MMRRTEEKRSAFVPAIIIVSAFLFLEFGRAQPLQEFEPNFEYDAKPHGFGLNRLYTAEYKRLPVYDFGLGKRFDTDENSGYSKEYEDYPYGSGNSGEDEDDSIPELDLYHDETMQTIEKRPNPYNFGLGKRQRYDFGLGKRGHHKYDFGLGKRGPMHRDRIYNMGLGKRTRLYAFGLGKRPYGPGPMGSRFNFGLGKRSGDEATNQITKREVQGKKKADEITGNGKGNKEELSNEEMPKSDSSDGRLAKRSPHEASSSQGKNENPNNRNAVGFSRQFRNPLYNFGLGKRTTSLESYKFSEK